MSSLNEVQKVADALAKNLDADILLFNAPLQRGVDRKIISLCASRKKRRNVLLIIVSEGGDADVAYRVSRCLQSTYTPGGKFICLISGYCKSAATVLVLGANELVFSRHGELGPLDVQMTKEDELWEWQSGLTVTASLGTLNEKAFAAFEDFFFRTKYDLRGGITLKTSAEVAAELTTGLYAPIFEQFDPMHIGDAARALLIAQQYGIRLDRRARNMKKETLQDLISGYPSHGFVIDCEEAAGLFVNVRKATEEEEALEKLLGDCWCIPIDERKQTPRVEFLSTELEEVADGAEVANVPDESAQHGPGKALAQAAGATTGNGDSGKQIPV